GLDLSAPHIPVLVHTQANGLDAVAHDFEGNLLQVQNDISGVFHHPRNRAEFVLYALDAHSGDGRAFNTTQQHAPQTIADRRAEPAWKSLSGKHAIPLRKGLGVGNQTFGFLKALKHIDPRLNPVAGAPPHPRRAPRAGPLTLSTTRR